MVERLAPTVDQLVVVASFGTPRYKPGLVDRLLVLAHHAEVEPLVVLNKTDLGDPDDVEAARSEYAEVGHRVVVTSVPEGRGIDELRERLVNARSVLTGHSGVGKSSLLKAVDPEITSEVTTGAVSRVTGKGRHTTTRVRVWKLSAGGDVIDLPGIRLLGLEHLDVDDVLAAFPEVAPAVGQCQFRDCSHGPEPGCAVRPVLEGDGLSDRRLESLERILESISWGRPD